MDPAFLGMLVLGGTSLLTFLGLWKKVNGVAEKIQIAQQPLDVRAFPQTISREDCERQHKAEERFMTARFNSLDTRIADLTAALERRNAEGEARASGIHKRVDAVASDLAAVKGTLQEHIAHGRHDSD